MRLEKDVGTVLSADQRQPRDHRLDVAKRSTPYAGGFGLVAAGASLAPDESLDRRFVEASVAERWLFPGSETWLGRPKHKRRHNVTVKRPRPLVAASCDVERSPRMQIKSNSI